MTEIEEIPLAIEEPTENTQEIPEHIPNNAQEITPLPTRKRGRPAGVKNKAKSKPKPKPKTKKPVEYDSLEEDEESEAETPPLPPPRRRARPEEQSQELDRHALASEVLGLLQQQRYDRTSARRYHYASWF